MIFSGGIDEQHWIVLMSTLYIVIVHWVILLSDFFFQNSPVGYYNFEV